MKKSRTMSIIVDPKTGVTQIEMKGFDGKSCMDASKFLEDALGDVAMRKKLKAFYRTNHQKTEYWDICG